MINLVAHPETKRRRWRRRDSYTVGAGKEEEGEFPSNQFNYSNPVPGIHFLSPTTWRTDWQVMMLPHSTISGDGDGGMEGDGERRKLIRKSEQWRVGVSWYGVVGLYSFFNKTNGRTILRVSPQRIHSLTLVLSLFSFYWMGVVSVQPSLPPSLNHPSPTWYRVYGENRNSTWFPYKPKRTCGFCSRFKAIPAICTWYTASTRVYLRGKKSHLLP